MKVLWVVNLVLPKVAHLVDEDKIPFGGWVSNMLDQLSEVEGIEISVVMRCQTSSVINVSIDDVNYYLIPKKSNDSFDVEQVDCEYVLKEVNPDIVHVEGSESAQGLRFLKAWKGLNVVSMQGILNGYKQYEVPNLLSYSSNFPSLIRDSIDYLALWVNYKLNFTKRVDLEKQTISAAKNILGRTHWDKFHSYNINKDAPYFECARVLRKGFYENLWNIENIKRHRIFIGNSAQGRKGPHIVFRAIKNLITEYPNVELVIAGVDPFQNTKNNRVGYRSFLKRQIEKLNLRQSISFTGVLQEEEMIKVMCSCHVFVMASLIENSPNTLGESMILGIPSITSYNGGVSDMALDGHSALFYRAEDPVLLAGRIKEIFDNDKLALKLSLNARKQALETHDPIKNRDKLLNAYKNIINGVTYTC